MKPNDLRHVLSQHMNVSRGNKYGAVKTEADSFTFDSKAEARRYQDLKLLERAGEIRNIGRQAVYKLAVNQVLIASYRADFTYEERAGSLREGYRWRLIVEDVKGFLTPEYKLKRALMKAIHNIDIRETR